MIHFFTDPYKDELIYSAIARYHFYSGNTDYKDTLEECLGKRSAIPTLEIGDNLEYLANSLGGKYTADSIIKNHTILPYYTPFLDKKRRKEINKEIKYNGGSSIYTKLGVVAGSVCKKNDIYYCPVCAKYEIDNYGEAFIHREHQLQGIFLCAKHGVWLEKYQINRVKASRIEFIRFDKSRLILDVKTKEIKYYDKLLKLSKDSYFLLQADIDNVDRKMILQKYKLLLYEKGLATKSKRVKQGDLYEEFIRYYGNDFLNIIQCPIDNENEYNWLRVITRDLKRASHPLRHLLLIDFLCGNIEEFFRNINKATLKTKEEFNNSNIYNIEKVNIDKFNKYKEDILQVIDNNKGITRTNLRDMLRKEYIYLYRYDKEWLFSKLPDKTKPQYDNNRIDWKKRDKEYLELIKVRYRELILNENPIRITKGNLAKQLGILVNIEKKIDKLPKTAEFLNEVCESISEFQVRRCKNAIDKFYETEEEIKLWKVQRIAAIRSNRFKEIQEQLKIYIDEKYEGV